MAAVNTRRVLLGAVVGGVVWTAWTMLVNIVYVGSHCEEAQAAWWMLDLWVRVVLATFVAGWLYKD